MMGIELEVSGVGFEGEEWRKNIKQHNSMNG